MKTTSTSRVRALVARAVRAVGFAVACVGAVAVAVGTPRSRAHDFEETRRVVLSVHPDAVELLVAWELRPGALARGLVAQWDADHDGRATTPWERLARSRVLLPRFTHGFAVALDGRRMRLSLDRLEIADDAREAGETSLSALALYRAPLPGAAERTLTVRALAPRGAVTLEAQADDGIALTSAELEGRPHDPVLGPASLRPGTTVTVVIR